MSSADEPRSMSFKCNIQAVAQQFVTSNQPRYSQWITDYQFRVIAEDRQKHPDMGVTGMCVEAVEEMGHDFPELRAVRGHVHFPGDEGKPWPHWWLVDEEGLIVDPTASQFPQPIIYEPWDEQRPEPTGKCHNCGAYCYNDEYICSRRCIIALTGEDDGMRGTIFHFRGQKWKDGKCLGPVEPTTIKTGDGSVVPPELADLVTAGSLPSYLDDFDDDLFDDDLLF